jgi:hypothetical protein
MLSLLENVCIAGEISKNRLDRLCNYLPFYLRSLYKFSLLTVVTIMLILQLFAVRASNVSSSLLFS